MVEINQPAKILLSVAKTQDERASIEEMRFAVNYLSTFGYLAKFAWDNREDIIKAVKQFQKWFGTKSDGVVGPKTLKAMQHPRCGCPDIVDTDNADHREYLAMTEFAEANLAKWNKTGLKYYIRSYVKGLSKTDQQAIIAGAWKAWDDVCGVVVSPASRSADADLIVDTGEGSRSNFDGAGGTLAWAYLPNGNDRQLLMRFDLGETWISNPNERGVLLFNVACHEFGHMLGLDHSKVRGALMAPTYNSRVAVPQWDDDIPRVQARYGQNTNGPTVPVPPTPPAGDEFHVVCKALQVQGYRLVPE